MTPEQIPFLAVAMSVVAFLYSSVGHAGASGYIAVMSLFSLTPGVIKPTALLLNILVASIGTWQFWRAGHFSWRLSGFVFWEPAVPAQGQALRRTTQSVLTAPATLTQRFTPKIAKHLPRDPREPPELHTLTQPVAFRVQFLWPDAALAPRRSQTRCLAR